VTVLRLRLALVAALLLAAVAAPAATAAVTPRATSAQAERNLLGAVRVLDRWRVGITNRRTGVLPANTTARCVGRGRSVAGRFTSFQCTIRRGTLRVGVLYVVLKRNGFELRHHRVVRR
jgi:hypothetical protein